MSISKRRDTAPKDPTSVSLGALVNDVARLFNRKFDGQVGHLSLTRAQWKVLLYLKRREGLSQSELKDLLEVSPPALAKLLDNLESKSWIERRPDPGDRRTNRLYLTRSVEPLLRRVHVVAAENDRQALAELSDKEAAELTRLMLKVKQSFRSRDEDDDEKTALTG